MSSTVLVSVKNHAPWAREVAEVVTSVEDRDTEAVVLHVFDDAELAAMRTGRDDAETASLDDLAAHTSGVDAATDVLLEEGLDVTSHGVRQQDRTADAILDVIDSVAADRVYLYGRQRSPAGKAVFGSTVQQVVLDGAVPVTIVPAGVAGW